VAFPTFVFPNKTKLKSLEAEVGIEPTNEAFAEPCLTTWLLRRSSQNKQVWCPGKNGFVVTANFFVEKVF
jgi:hypothetical protein